MDTNEHKYYYFNLCLFVFIRGFVYPLFSFLFFERSRCLSFYVYLQVVPKAT